jgi:biopolymer transport protein ExbD
MADMNIPGGNDHNGKVRMKKANLRVDLTPMVDLAFLLISFFMLTTTLMKQKAISLTAPDSIHPPEPASECQILNLLADSTGHVYYWEGLDCRTVNPIALTGEHTLKDKIKAKKAFLKSNCLFESGKSKELICLIKLLPGSHYEHMVRVLDEMVTDSVPVYAIQNYSDDEIKAVQTEQQKMAMR